MKKSGFTLAEILITLTILGIIASLVIPNVYEKYQRKITVNKVRKMYSMLTSAYNQYLAENNNVAVKFPMTEDGAKNSFNKYIKPYFEISVDAGTNTNKKSQIMKNENVKNLDGSESSKNYTNNFRYYGAKLKDGSVIFIRGSGNDQEHLAAIFYIVDGNKNNIVIGKNLFVFYYLPNGIQPYHESTFSFRTFYETYCITSEGFGCNAWILAKGNMEYLNCPNKNIWETGKCK